MSGAVTEVTIFICVVVITVTRTLWTCLVEILIRVVEHVFGVLHRHQLRVESHHLGGHLNDAVDCDVEQIVLVFTGVGAARRVGSDVLEQLLVDRTLLT